MTTTYLFPFPSTLQGLTDVSVSPGVTVDDYPLTYDHGLGKWVASNNIAGITVRAGAGARTQAIGSIANSTGVDWIAQGSGAGAANTIGSNWIAQSTNAGNLNTIGNNWMAQGPGAGQANTAGGFWVAQGSRAGQANTTGSNWISQGPDSGLLNVSQSNWIAQGPFAASKNTGGNYFVATGSSAAGNSTTGSAFVALGGLANLNGTTNAQYVSIGFFSAFNNVGGDGYVAIGDNAAFESGSASNFLSIGRNAGYFDNRSNFLNIGNSNSKSLICGNFANDCIYFGHAGPITSSANVPIPTAAVHAAASNTTRASLRIDAGVAPTSPFTGDIWMNVSNNSVTLNFPLLNLGNNQVLTTTRTGWAAPTGIAARGTFDTATVTVEELAQRLKALIDDLTTHGLIGA